MLTRSLRPVAIIILAFLAATSAAALPNTFRTPVIDLFDESQSYEVLGHADVLDDPTGNLDIDDVAHSTAFRPGTPDSQPADSGVRWYRFRATTAPRSNGRWYLASSNLCENADLYLPRANSLFALQSFGTAVPFAQHPTPWFLPGTLLGDLDGQTLFVRLRCAHSRQYLAIAAAAWAWANNYGQMRNTAFCSLLILAALAAGLAIVTRSRAYAFVSLSGLFWAILCNLFRLPQWFPNTVVPFVLIHQLARAAAFISQTLFYDSFFELRTITDA